MKDLHILCPDSNWKAVLEALLARPEALGTHPIETTVRAKTVGTDGGTRAHGVKVLESLLSSARHALLIFDWEGCGDPRQPSEIQAELDGQLAAEWDDRARSIVVQPELEIWLLGAHKQFRRLPPLAAVDARAWWDSSGQWPTGAPKPLDPKAAVESLFLQHRVKRSSANYRKIASRASLRPERCQHPAFRLFVETLRRWFPST